jgi:hypothetical protein
MDEKRKNILKRIAKIVYNVYHNFWIELIGKIILFLFCLFNSLMIVIGPEIDDDKFDKFDRDSFLITSSIILLLYLLYKWAKWQIKDELEECKISEEREKWETNLGLEEICERYKEEKNLYLKKSLIKRIIHQIYHKIRGVLGWILTSFIVILLIVTAIWYSINLIRLVMSWIN